MQPPVQQKPDPIATGPEAEEAEARSSPSAAIVYEAIRTEGERELKRNNSQLFWSGLAAGLSMGFSLLSEALLQRHLPPGPGKDLLVKLGYSVGFLIVILGRQQLFTENTLTPVLPVLRGGDGCFRQLLRLWLVVFVANMIGAFIFAACMAFLPIIDHATLESAVAVSAYVDEGHFWVNLQRAVIAGWLIALLVWLMPFAESGRIWIIILLTYLVGVGEFPHIIAGAVKAFMLVLLRVHSFNDLFLTAFLPVLLGNMIGGVALVALINHAQVKKE